MICVNYARGFAAVPPGQAQGPVKNQPRRVGHIPLPTFAILFFFALIFHLLAAFSSRGSESAGEQFQAMELARSKAFHHAQTDLAADLRQKSRPMLQPALALLLAQGANQCGITNRSAQIVLAGIVSAALGICLSLLMFSTYRERCTTESARTWLFSLLLLLWFLVSIHASFSPEAWAGMLFFSGIIWFLRHQSEGDAINILIGIPFGLSLFFRFEALFMIAGFVAWLVLVEHEDLQTIASLVVGVAGGVLVGILVDRNLYGEWTFTPWNYLTARGPGGAFFPSGAHPWWFYFSEIFTWGTYPIGGLVVVTGLLFFVLFRREVLTWVVLPYLVVHMLLPAKDLRFLFPLVPAVPVMIFLSLQKVYSWVRPESAGERVDRFAYWIVQPVWIFNLILLVVVSLVPADTVGPAYRKLLGQSGSQSTVAQGDGSTPASVARPGGAVASSAGVR